MKSDLAVDLISPSLKDKTIDVVVTGSIAAVESVRFVRSLRRLGASVRVILSDGGADFISPMALEWASCNEVQRSFSGKISHLAEHDALVVAPASAHFLTSVARGDSDKPERALFQSYLGQKKPVYVLPCMHHSLSQSPLYLDAIHKIEPLVRWLNSRDEEGKNKFPDPASLADEVSHLLNFQEKHILLTMGGTRAAIDDVRYIGNISTGALGTDISAELFRRGFQSHIVCGAAEHRPKQSFQFVDAQNVHDMQKAIIEILSTYPIAVGIFSAAVSDYEPIQSQSGKLRSGQNGLQIDLKPTPKILDAIKDWPMKKIGFKLEPELNPQIVEKIFIDYSKKYNLNAMVLNAVKDVGPTSHVAVFAAGNQTVRQLNTKRDIASAIVNWIDKGETK